MIYFDNAATGGFKPRTVFETAENVMLYLCANPGRSGHRLSLTGAETVYACRVALSETFGALPERVIFTKNCTEALNIAILGSLKRGDRVITTIYEHNSVLRPLTRLKNEGVISLDIVAAPPEEIPDKIKEAVTPDTAMIVASALGNVSGEILPVRKIGKIARENGLLFVCDGAQAGGHIPLSLKDDYIDMLCLAGHKGLFGIMGSGALLVGERADPEPLVFGGTGTESFNLNQPECYPEKLESGTLSLPAIASLSEGVRYAAANMTNFAEILSNYTEYAVRKLSLIEGVKIYSAVNPAGIVSFSLSGVSSQDAADILNSEYDIAVRGGLHCAPLMHKYLGTDKDGLVRASFSSFNTTREINALLSAVKRICNN